jgi:hypothetical protein
MSQVRSFSISWKRNQMCLTLYCLAPSGKEHVTTLYFEPSEMEHLASSIEKALTDMKNKCPKPKDGASYIG